MRVITGEAKGRILKVPKASTTRPMTDMVKGALFAMLTPLGLAERRVLDLYAGSGSIGIEALSRGAASADFVEQSASVCAVIDDNLKRTRFETRGRVMRAKVAPFLVSLSTRPRPPDQRYDLVFMDPPYADPGIVDTLTAAINSPALADDAIVVVGHSSRAALPDDVGPASRLHLRCHGDSCFSIYTVPAGSSAQIGAEPRPG